MVIATLLVGLALLGVRLQLQALNQLRAIWRDPQAGFTQSVEQGSLNRCNAIPHRGVSRRGHVGDVVALQDVNVAPAAVGAAPLARGIWVAKDPRIWEALADLLTHGIGVVRLGHHAEHPQLAPAPDGEHSIAVAHVEIHARDDRLVRVRKAWRALVGPAEPVA